MRSGPVVTVENIRWLLANDGFGDLVGDQSVRISRAEQLYRALTLAAECGHLDLAAELVAQGADVRRGAEPLAAAAEHGHVPLIDFLMEAGATVDERAGYWGKTPLMHAACGGEPDAVIELLRYGADPRAGDNEGQTALKWAEIGRDGYHGLDPRPADELARLYAEVIRHLRTATNTAEPRTAADPRQQPGFGV
jgi:Ankyrin repeats (3 copies)